MSGEVLGLCECGSRIVLVTETEQVEAGGWPVVRITTYAVCVGCDRPRPRSEEEKDE